MSRIGKLPVIIPSNVEVSITENTVLVKGPKGELQIEYKPLVKITLTDNEVQVNPVNETKEARSMHGLYRSLISNMVTGVTNGYEKRLEIQGVGYRVKKTGTNLEFSLGFSHPVKYTVKETVSAEIDKEKNNIIIVSGIDKQHVGQVAAEIRSLKKPEPYKGKGIRYVGERIIRKAGKQAAK
ncbi:50S ribosomal protein L6 [bacterium]|nr:50S ribosomal protein L6 [bacterium]